MKLTLATLCACAALAGCGSTPGKYDNAVLTTLNGDRAFAGLQVGSFGITLELRAQDARELQALREKARDADELARMLLAPPAPK